MTTLSPPPELPAWATGWLPLPPGAPPGPGRRRTAVLASPVPAERGFWVALGHLLPGVRRHWRAPGTDEEAVMLVDGAGSRAGVAPDGSQAVEWSSRALWAETEAVHARWAAAGRPAVYGVEFAGHRIRVAGGTGLSWELPVA
ncbi:hypothetical protein [Kitasatospora phosalacinea]|uniref:Uncharacterized protein n=1 Tax=Kitasatospora phosalacinea TaxID=2065 RepID=A0A9W6PKP6_9ACTN|nr:hypothetical protein [Kitasatospora phosalacinea]GLW58070.1 hypothetical protein Kpho01_60810 [Kitasatospora phosalacinea]